jgi:hypothetical protein
MRAGARGYVNRTVQGNIKICNQQVIGSNPTAGSPMKIGDLLYLIDQCAFEAAFCGKIRINATITTINASDAV